MLQPPVDNVSPPQSSLITAARETVAHALPGLDLTLSAGQIEALLAYLDLISKWTKVYNLTAVRDSAEMMTHHLMDCLAAMAPLRAQFGQSQSAALGNGMGDGGAMSAQKAEPSEGSATVQGARSGVRLLDVGSGAGLPGVVIAICFPDVSVTCVDTVAKKTAFIKQVALTLKLPNLIGLHARVEALSAPEVAPFEVICSRAFASLADFTRWSAGALTPNGIWMAMKGKHPADELAALPQEIDVFHVEQLKVPHLDAERCIVWMRKHAANP